MNTKREKEMIIPVTGPETDNVKQDKKTGTTVPENENEYIDRIKRLQAEFINYKKRVQREKDEISAWSEGELIKKLLPVIDDMERMQMYAQDSFSDARTEGIGLIYKNMYKILQDEGLEEINDRDAEFNPEIHEAVSVEKTGKDKDGKVVEVWQKGYTFKGRLLRPGKVKVGRCFNDGNNEMM
ncbi:nucleotide exchange factor GrpE [bacterium]|nr:nucleotide exchange factor GrpE [bacterium]